jgi:hypothetical protein
VAHFYIAQGDRRPILQATLEQPAGTAINLSGATVTLYARHVGGLASIVGYPTVTNATAGTIQYFWGASDTAVAGRYMAEFDLDYLGYHQTVPNDTFVVILIREELG